MVRDADHAKAVALMQTWQGRIITTDWVLAELGNFLSARGSRALFVPFVKDLPADPRMEIMAAEREQFEAGCTWYAARADKEWSLTDCISMVVMQQRSVRDVFSTDHHFAQAGYSVLLS
jgi:predicted nucleic acid-binding protein